MLALLELEKRIIEMIKSEEMAKSGNLFEQLLKVEEEFGIRDIILTENGIEIELDKEEFDEYDGYEIDEDEFDLFDLI